MMTLRGPDCAHLHQSEVSPHTATYLISTSRLGAFLDRVAVTCESSSHRHNRTLVQVSSATLQLPSGKGPPPASRQPEGGPCAADSRPRSRRSSLLVPA